MITVGDTNIKLQIWDTVFIYLLLYRQDNNHLNLLLEVIIVQQQVLF